MVRAPERWRTALCTTVLLLCTGRAGGAPAAPADFQREIDELTRSSELEHDFSVDPRSLSGPATDEVAPGAEEGIVVYAATRSPQRIEEAPAIITVLTRDDLAAWGYQSIEDVLRHQVGFHVVDDHTLPNLGVRGTSGGLRADSGIIKVMIDGRSIAFRSTAGNWLGIELVPMSAVERIEIIRGPASAVYGADAFLGVVNVVTRHGADLSGADTRLQGVASGKEPGFGVDLAGGTRYGRFDLLASARFLREDRSGLALPTTSPAPVIVPYSEGRRDSTGLDRMGGVGLFRATYQRSARESVAATGYLSWLDRGAEFADWAQLAHGLDTRGQPAENRVSLMHGLFELSGIWGLGERLDLTFGAATFAGAPTSRDRIEVGSDLYRIRRELGYRGADAELGVRYRPLPSLTMTVGASLSYDSETLPSILHVLKRDAGDLPAGSVREQTSTRQGNTELVNPGALLQTLWTVAPGVGLSGGLRYDHHNIYGSQLSGRLGAVVSPSTRVHVKLLYGSAFKAPSPVLLYGVPLVPGDILGNPNLRPQFVHTFEGQVSVQPLSGVSLATGLSYNFLEDQAEFTRQGINTVARNVAEAGILSWESELSVRYKQHARGYANLAYLPITNRDLGEEGYRAQLVGAGLPAYPRTVVNTGLLARVPGLPLRAGLEGSFIGRRRASDTNVLERTAVYSLDSYFLLGGTVSTQGLHPIRDRETVVRVVARNLLDHRGEEPGFTGIDYPLQGRWVLLELLQQL